jgi:hypothetical protein
VRLLINLVLERGVPCAERLDTNRQRHEGPCDRGGEKALPS